MPRIAACTLFILLACPLHASSSFVGSARCEGCHSGVYNEWEGSHHRQAMQQATPETILGNFDNTEFTYNGTTSRFFVRDGKYYVRTDGPEGQLQDYLISYTFGLTPLQQYLVAFPDGRIQALSIAWDSRPIDQGGQRWFHLYPDLAIDHQDELHWTGSLHNWNHMCADCHSTHLVKSFDASSGQFDTRWSEISVGCEACHGPGSDHVAWADNREASTTDTTMGLAFALTGRLPSRWTMNTSTGTAEISLTPHAPNEIEVCASCHSRRSALHPGAEADPVLLNHYMPALLTEGLYHADGQIQDEVFVWGSFTQSRMFAAGVSCSDCHDPHSQQLRAPGDAVCAQCHLPAKFAATTHHGHAKQSAGASCLACHMPETTYMVVDPRRDHSLRIPRPDHSLQFGTPNACSQCHAAESATWLADNFQRLFPAVKPPFQNWTHAFSLARAGSPQAEPALLEVLGNSQTPDIARATAARELSSVLGPHSIPALRDALFDPSPLVRVAALGTAEHVPPQNRFNLAGHLLTDPSLAVRVEAGRVLAAVPREPLDSVHRQQLEKAVDEYVASQQRHADRAESQMNLAALYDQMGDAAQAEKHYRQALLREPKFAPAYVNLAELFRQRGLQHEATKLLRQGLDVQPRSASLHHALGLTLVRNGDTAAAVTELALAAELQPENARFAYVYGIALNSTQRPHEALKALQSARQAHPNDRQILFALATINRDIGQIQPALEWSRALTELYPSDRNAQQLLIELRAAARQAR